MATSKLKKNTNISIVDVTGKSCTITKSKTSKLADLTKYKSSIPNWQKREIRAYSALNKASIEQKNFYQEFKQSFLNGQYLDLEGNSNYAYILFFDLTKGHKFYHLDSELENEVKCLRELVAYYPETTNKVLSFVISQMVNFTYGPNYLNDDDNDQYHYKNKGSIFFDDYKEEDDDENSKVDYDKNLDSDDNFWGLGNIYKKKLKLNEEQERWLNKFHTPTSKFCSIEFCLLQVIHLYLAIMQQLKNSCAQQQLSIGEKFTALGYLISKEEFGFTKNNWNHRYAVKDLIEDFYLDIFEYCENAVCDLYNYAYKRKPPNDYVNKQAKDAYETDISSKIANFINIHIPKITLADEATEIALYAHASNRWKIKFERITQNYQNNPEKFVEDILYLVKLNQQNKSVKNIFFDAAKFISKYNKKSTIYLYVYYVYYAANSSPTTIKPLPKTIQKKLFQTTEQTDCFLQILAQLKVGLSLDKALLQAQQIYQVKRKKIQLNTTSIKQIQQKHSGTVELLNQYLEDETDTDNSQENSNKKTPPKSEPIVLANNCVYHSELLFNQIQIATLELFANNGLEISHATLEKFAKSKGVFINQLIESINDVCYNFLAEDLLIEQQADLYYIDTDYYNAIFKK